MATLVGIKAAGPLYASLAIAPAMPAPPTGPSAYAVTRPRQGTLVHAAMSPQPGGTKSGFKRKSFVDVFYERVHFIPKTVNFGSVTQPRTKDLWVWNAHFVPNALSGIEGPVRDDIVISPAGAVTFRELEVREYKVAASAGGPTSLDSNWTFNFALTPAVLRVSGKRVIPFPFGIDWGGGMTERIEFKTDILRSDGGAEQRAALRTTPRRFFEMTMWREGVENTVRARNAMFKLQGQKIVMPMWHQAVFLKEALPEGAVTIEGIDTTTADFIAGHDVILWRSPTENENATILSTTSDSIILTSPTDRVWELGTKVLPARSVRFEDSQEIVTPAGNLQQFRVLVSVNANTKDEPLESIVTYRGLGVMLKPFSANEDPTETLNRERVYIDNEVVDPFIDDPAGFPSIVIPVHWPLVGREEIFEYRGWLQARLGCCNAFWLPTWRREFTLTRNIAAVDSYLYVRDVGYTEFINGHAARCNLMLLMKDGTKRFVSLRPLGEQFISDNLEALQASGEEMLGMEMPMGEAILVEDVERICYLQKVRLDVDTIELEHKTDGYAESTVNVRTVIQ